MAYVDGIRSYNMAPGEKASMIMVLDQFSEDLETIRLIRWQITVSGSFCITSHEAVILARLIQPHYPHLSERLLKPLDTAPAMSPDEWRVKYNELVERVS